MERISFRSKSRNDQSHLSLLDCCYGRQTTYSSTIFAVRCVGPAQSVQAARAMILSGGSLSTEAISDDRDLLIAEPKVDDDDGKKKRLKKRSPSELMTVKMVKLPLYNQAMLSIRTLDDRFRIGSIHEAVTAYLFSQSIDTPILHSWSKWLVDELFDGRFIVKLKGNIESWYCNFDSKIVDATVTRGVSSGKLKLL